MAIYNSTQQNAINYRPFSDKLQDSSSTPKETLAQYSNYDLFPISLQDKLCIFDAEKVLKSYDFRTFGGDKRDRTADLLNAIQALSQLSYTPIFGCAVLFSQTASVL